MKLTEDCTTIVQVLQARAQVTPDALAYAYLDSDQIVVSYSYAELDRRCRAIAAELASYPLHCRALLLYPPGLEYVEAFFACLYAGIIAVPAYPPDPTRLVRSVRRLQAIAKDAQAELVLTTQMLANMAPMLGSEAPELTGAKWLASDTINTREADASRTRRIAAEDIAFLQYTSGSTGDPKGVIVSHANLMHNLALIDHFQQNDESSVSLSWLPAYHDMGLIGGILEPLFYGHPAYLMSPIAFLQRPLSWLRAIDKYRATSSGAPNFAFDLCVRRTTPDERQSLDLSSWRVAYNGAEPNRKDTLESFLGAFSGAGFRRASFCPGFGLAEATLVVSGGNRCYEPCYLELDAVGLQHHRVVLDGAADQALVACGRPEFGMEVVIVDPEQRRRCGRNEIGEIWVAGPSITQGYWNRPELTAEVFGAELVDGAGPFFRSGDLGFMHDGQLYLTGRLKDLIIVRGRNHYPHDIEASVEGCAGIRRGCTAAFAHREAPDRLEQLAVVSENTSALALTSCSPRTCSGAM